MVYRAQGTKVYKLRVSDNAGHSATRTTGTTDEAVAQDVERMVDGFRAQRKWAWLTLIATKRVELPLAYDAFVAGRIEAFMDQALSAESDVDLSPLVTEWAKRANAKYVAQVRVFIPEADRFPVSQFTRGRISAFLAGLDVEDPTRNRYRAALSVFAKWLVEREVLETNPVRDVAAYKEHDPRELWLTWKDAERVARKADAPFDVLLLLLAGTGIEISAALRLTVYDVDSKAGTIHAKGSKTRWRNRTVRAEPFVWAALKRHTLRGMNGELFPSITERQALAAFKAAQAAAKIDGHVLHDLRHSYAVNALKAGLRAEVVSHQLGHKDASMVVKIYGRYLPDAADYKVVAATSPATAPIERMNR